MTVRTIVGVLVLSAAVLAAGPLGCQGLAEVQQFRAEAVALRDELQQEAASWEARLTSLPPAHPLRPDAEAAQALAHARFQAMEAAVKQAELVIAEATDPQDTLTQTVGAVAPLIPEPARLPLLLGAACIVTLARAAQLKRGMTSIARGIQKAMEEDPKFQDAFRQHANTFRTIQTRAAKRIVDEATGDGFMVRLPV